LGNNKLTGENSDTLIFSLVIIPPSKTRQGMLYSVSFILAILVSCFAKNAYAQEITQDALKKALKQNPEIVIQFLKEHKSEVLEILNEAASESKIVQGQRSMDESFNNPLQPKISDQTRMRGNKAAKYTLVEYGDFQCPFCGNGYRTVEALREKYGSDLRFIYKHLPLTAIHPMAMLAARYMEAISLQSEDKAWNFHDIIFQNQNKLSESFYQETAKSIGVDVDRLAVDLKSDKISGIIEADSKEAGEMGFQGTPGFLLNGIPVRGAYPVDYFETIIAKLAEKKGASAAAQ
jgi:protein-disulfide isomerase